MAERFIAGAAVADLTPAGPVFLFGYPHVARYSTGVHDRLLSSALYLSDGRTGLIFIANDVIYISKTSARRVRKRITRATGVPEANIMVTATHTHSGPITVDCVFCQGDPAVPKADPAYVATLEDAIVQAAGQAVERAQPAEIAFAVADATGVGTHRRDPSGPREPAVPVLAVRSTRDAQPIALMLVCAMHPTVLHEDSTLVSGDFPAAARACLQRSLLPPGCPVLHHTGPCGNQSPRHVVRGQTFAEADRLGELLGRSVESAVRGATYRRDVTLSAARAFVELPVRAFPAVADAERVRDAAASRLADLRAAGAPAGQVRTAEVDWFGAEEQVTWARAAETGQVREALALAQPAEVQVVRIGDSQLVAWPGEVFIEYAIEVRRRHPNAFVISLANGELEGYVVTEAAAAGNWYEANIALFAPAAGQRLVETSLALLEGR